MDFLSTSALLQHDSDRHGLFVSCAVDFAAGMDFFKVPSKTISLSTPYLMRPYAYKPSVESEASPDSYHSRDLKFSEGENPYIHIYMEPWTDLVRDA